MGVENCCGDRNKVKLHHKNYVVDTSTPGVPQDRDLRSDCISPESSGRTETLDISELTHLSRSAENTPNKNDAIKKSSQDEVELNGIPWS